MFKLNKILAASLVAFSATAAFAQSENIAPFKPLNFDFNPEQIQEEDDRSAVFVEFFVPIEKSGKFAEAIEDQLNSGAGIGGKFGWQPFEKIKTDSPVGKVLKNAGFTFDANNVMRTPFKDYLYTTENRVASHEIANQCYSYDEYDNMYWNSSCSECDDGRGYCTNTDVYGRDSYVKYTKGTIALGMYVPFKVSKKLALEAGTNVRWHFIKEGIQSDRLVNTTEKSFGLTANAAYNFNSAIAVTGNFEQAVAGRKYRAYKIGFRINLPTR